MRTSSLALGLLLACTREPPPTGGSPLQGLAPAHEREWHGVVEERLVAGSYSYLAVRDAAALRWVAVMGPGEPPGRTVVVHAMGMRTDFHSARLDRDFAELFFATVQPEPGSS